MFVILNQNELKSSIGAFKFVMADQNEILRKHKIGGRIGVFI